MSLQQTFPKVAGNPCPYTNLIKHKIPLHNPVILLLFSLFIINPLLLTAQRQMEYLNRGVVAVRTGSSQVYIGWRMMGTDPSGIGFNVYRGSTKLNASPITSSTNYVDNTSSNSSYTVRPVIGGVEQAASEAATVWAQNYLQIPLQRPAGGATPAGEAYTYAPNDCSVGDLDGDGAYEIVVKWDPSNAKDNAQSGYTGNVYLDAYEFNGTRLWRIDLGRNIRAGAHYTQFLVYDFDGDGKAEVACKTADATVDGTGTVIGSASADYRNSSGYILSGPEYLTVFNGQTGAAMATTNYLPARGTVSSWGDNYGNRVDRFIACVAYADGQRPSMVFGRGYYTRLVRVAWDWRNGQLTHRWTFDSNTSGNGSYAGQGNHQMTVGDVDNDGRDEVFNGSSAVNDNGSGYWANGMGHGDALHMSDMDPNRSGQEIWMPYEYPPGNGQVGAALIDARTGARIFTVPEASDDVGRGLAADIDPRYTGYEMWASRGNLYTCTGASIGTSKPSMNFAVWWDDDLQRELLDNITISKWNYSSSSASTLLSATGCASNNGTKATPALSADILGDWREEVIFRTSDNTALRIYTTTSTASNRIYTLMHDPQYRLAIAWQNAAYNQPPHPGFYLGGGMSAPPTPNIYLAGAPPTGGTTITIQENSTGFCSVDGTVDNNNAGYTGSGFANTDNAANTGVNWRISVPSSGNYTLTFRYANGGGADRPGRVMVNGSTVVSNLSFPATADWTTWTTVSTTLSLSVGIKDIRLEATGSSGLGNIDRLEITGDNPAAQNCSGSSITTITIQENATGFCSVDGTVDNNNAGFTGNGFANTNNAAGTGVNWSVIAPSSGSYTLTWRYANGGGADRPGNVLVNSSTAASGVSFPATTDWTTWTTTSANVTLSAGTNTIRLQATGSTGLGNIDYMEVTGNSPDAQNCSSAITAVSALTVTTGNAVSSRIAITPNPTTEAFEITAQGNFRYSIFDQLGREVERGAGQNKIRVGRQLTPGAYIIQIIQGKTVTPIKVIRQ